MARETTQPSDQQQGGSMRSQATTSSSHPQGQQRDRERAIAIGRDEGTAQGRSSSELPRRQGGSALSERVRSGGYDSPLALMQRIAEDMDRLFEQFGVGRSGLGLTPGFGDLLNRDLFGGRSVTADAGQALWSPQVELRQKGDKLVIRADLPGVKKDDLHVDVEDDVLTIRGERRDQREDHEKGFFRTERSYGEFYRAIPLPEGVDADQCDASYRDGVLEITLPAPTQETRNVKRIQIR